MTIRSSHDATPMLQPDCSENFCLSCPRAHIHTISTGSALRFRKFNFALHWVSRSTSCITQQGHPTILFPTKMELKERCGCLQGPAQPDTPGSGVSALPSPFSTTAPESETSQHSARTTEALDVPTSSTAQSGGCRFQYKAPLNVPHIMEPSAMSIPGLDSCSCICVLPEAGFDSPPRAPQRIGQPAPGLGARFQSNPGTKIWPNGVRATPQNRVAVTQGLP